MGLDPMAVVVSSFRAQKTVNYLAAPKAEKQKCPSRQLGLTDVCPKRSWKK